VRAVIFDLWDTLVEWPVDEGEVLKRRVAEHVGGDPTAFEELWRASYRASQTGSLAEVYRWLGIPDEHVDAHVAARHEFGRRVLRLERGVREAIAELRRRGLKLGLITVCSEEVPLAWPETDLAGLFDAETFSSECGLVKPEPEIYLRTAAALGVETAECFFVGDGANDELAGAERVGMTPVLFVPPGREPLWPQVRGWRGLRVSSVAEVVRLVPA
jgi:putative hydrolase of the HAD superfamily